MKKAILIFLLLGQTLFGQYKKGDPVVYSRYFVMITGIENIEVFEVHKISGNTIVLKNSEGKKLGTHTSSVQPIFDPDAMFQDRTIRALSSKYGLGEISGIEIRSKNLMGDVSDSVFFTGQEYKLKILSDTEKFCSLTLVDTFHYKNVGIKFFGINDGVPNYFVHEGDGQPVKDSVWKENPLLFETFMKIDGLRLYKDETLNYNLKKN